MKVAIVHDDLVQWGGAERMLLGISEVFPDAPIYTSVFDYNNQLLVNQFKSKKIVTSFMQKIPGWRSMYKPLFFLYPVAFEQFDFSQFDLVISQTTRFSKSVITKPETIHICYMHTPPRFLWGFSQERVPLLLKPFLRWFRLFDKVSAERPDYYLAGSKNAEQRIRQVYGKSSEVLYPFVDPLHYKNIETYDGGYYLVISRLNKYKNVDLVVRACKKLNLPLKIVGKGSELYELKANSGSQTEFLQGIPDFLLVELIAGCKALVVAAEEDFGLTPLEAQSMGKPVIALGRGGVLETVIPGKTGILFTNPTVKDLVAAIETFESKLMSKDECFKQAKKFSKDMFKKRLIELVEKCRHSRLY